jgi:hypothetical protein
VANVEGAHFTPFAREEIVAYNSIAVPSETCATIETALIKMPLSSPSPVVLAGKLMRVAQLNMIGSKLLTTAT